MEPFPHALLELFERLTGERFPVDLITTWERVRAFGGYQGIDFCEDPSLRLRMAITDPVLARAALDPVEPPRRGRAATPAVLRTRRTPQAPIVPEPRRVDGARPPDPEDLGD